MLTHYCINLVLFFIEIVHNAGQNFFNSCYFSFQPGPRDGTIQCFIKRDKSNLTYHLFLCLSPGKHFAHVRNSVYLLCATTILK